MTNSPLYSYLRKIDYYEIIVVFVISLLIIKDIESFESNLILLFILSVAIILSLIVIVFDFRNSNDEKLPYYSVMLSGFLAGITIYDVIIFVVLSLGIVIRTIKTPNQRIKLSFMAVLTAIWGFLLNKTSLITINFLSSPFSSNLIISTLMTFLILFDYANLRRKSLLSVYQLDEYKKRVQEQTKVANNLTRFIPNQIWKPIIINNKSANIFNKRARVTIFFSDIMNFTKLSDDLSADTLTEILNTYMDRMTIVARRHDAILDKFIGDGMMCIFGAHGHDSVEDNASRCIAMALDMRREMIDLRRKWQYEGFEGFYIRMGINTGFCHVGNFGTDLRMSYTAIGKEVNLAARLEAAAKPDEIIISQSTYDYINNNYFCEVVGDIELKGFEKRITCWKVLEAINSDVKSQKSIDHDLPEFNLYMNFEDIENYDHSQIKEYINVAIQKIDHKEEVENLEINQKR